MSSSYLMILLHWKRSQHPHFLLEGSAVKIPPVSFPLAPSAWPYSLFSLTKVIRLQSQAKAPHTCVFHSSQKVRRNYCALNSPCQKDDKQREGGAGSTGAQLTHSLTFPSGRHSFLCGCHTGQRHG